MKKETWPTLLAECLRVLRPGGWLRVTEQVVALSNDALAEEAGNWWYKAFHLAGYSFSASPDSHYYGTALVLKRLLTRAGFVHPSHRAFALDFSTGTKAHETMMEDLILSFQVGGPFLERYRIATLERIREVQNYLWTLLNKEDFCGYWIFLSVLARKPGE